MENAFLVILALDIYEDQNQDIFWRCIQEFWTEETSMQLLKNNSIIYKLWKIMNKQFIVMKCVTLVNYVKKAFKTSFIYICTIIK